MESTNPSHYAGNHFNYLGRKTERKRSSVMPVDDQYLNRMTELLADEVGYKDSDGQPFSMPTQAPKIETTSMMENLRLLAIKIFDMSKEVSFSKPREEVFVEKALEVIQLWNYRRITQLAFAKPKDHMPVLIENGADRTIFGYTVRKPGNMQQWSFGRKDLAQEPNQIIIPASIYELEKSWNDIMGKDWHDTHTPKKVPPKSGDPTFFSVLRNWTITGNSTRDVGTVFWDVLHEKNAHDLTVARDGLRFERTNDVEGRAE